MLIDSANLIVWCIKANHVNVNKLMNYIWLAIEAEEHLKISYNYANMKQGTSYYPCW